MFNVWYMKNKFNLIDGIKTWLKPSDIYFDMFGFVTFCGEQGSGKSLSVNRLIFNLKNDYPNLHIISNVHLPYCDYERFQGVQWLNNKPDEYRGIVLYLDEITNMFTSLDSKTINKEWFDLINMQRKRELLIIATCPVFSRIPKAFREQFDTIVLCKRVGTFQMNKICKCDSDMLNLAETTEEAMKGLKVKRINYFFHSLEDYERYNTRTLVFNGEERSLK